MNLSSIRTQRGGVADPEHGQPRVGALRAGDARVHGPRRREHEPAQPVEASKDRSESSRARAHQKYRRRRVAMVAMGENGGETVTCRPTMPENV